MASGSGVSMIGEPAPNASVSSLVRSAHPIDTPSHMGGETFKYQSKGGWVPGTLLTVTPKSVKTPKAKKGKKTKKGDKKHGGSRRRRHHANTKKSK